MRGAVAATAALVCLTAGCTSIPHPTPAPVVLRLAHVDGKAVLDLAPTWFADDLDRISGGALLVAWRVSCFGIDQSMQEQTLVDAVADCTYLLGWVGVRLFSALGDDDFTALTLPLVQDSSATPRAVAGGPIPGQVFAGLDRLRVAGLALMPGYLRKPLSTTRPVIGPADWKDTTTFLSRGGTSRDPLTALGARSVEGGSAEVRDDGLLARTIEGQSDRSSMRRRTRCCGAAGSPGRSSTRSARGTARLAQQNHDVAQYECEHGVSVVAAPPDRLAALRDAVRPVIAGPGAAGAVPEVTSGRPGGAHAAAPAHAYNRSHFSRREDGLMGWFARDRSGGAELGPLVDDTMSAVTLVAVLEEAVSHLGAAEELLERCALAGEPGHAAGFRTAWRPLGVADARQGLRLRVAFTQLSRWLDGLVCDPQQEALRADASRLLRFYLLMVTYAVDAAFIPPDRQHIAVRGGRGDAADRLVELRDLARATVG